MRGFLLIFGAGLGCAVLGSGLGWVMGWLSPEFVALVVQPFPVAEPERMGTALGLVCGMLLGVSAMAFGLLVDVVRTWLVHRAPRELPPNESLSPNGPLGDVGSATAAPRPISRAASFRGTS